MGHMCITASKVVSGTPINLTSYLLSPLVSTSISAHMTLFEATAATDGTQVIFVRCTTANLSSISWNDSNGIRLKSLYVAISGGTTTIAWN